MAIASQTARRVLLTWALGAVSMSLLELAVRVLRPDLLAGRAVDLADLRRPIRHTYDFVVVGGGSAGAVLASRLSEVPSWRVLLLEAGGEEPALSNIPSMAVGILRSDADWGFETEPQPGVCLAMEGGRCRWSQGKTLGGTSTLNGMLYVRGNRKDYDLWEAAGNPGWGYEAVLPFFKKSEDMRVEGLRHDERHHGTGGYLTLERFRYRTPLADAMLEAGRELGYDEVDVNGASQRGFARFYGTLRGGFRCGTAKAFLGPVRFRPNLDISLRSVVQRVIVDPDSTIATGVEFVKDGIRHVVNASREIIVSAGAINSPKLLMLSGIGPRDHLESLGIRVLSDLRVGDNLQDHIALGGLIFLLDAPVSFVLPRQFTLRNLASFLKYNEGPLMTTAIAETVAFVNSKYSNDTTFPDVALYLSSVAETADGGVYLKNILGLTDAFYSAVYEPVVYRDAFSSLGTLLHPKSRGTVRLRDRDPRSSPVISPNYLSHPDDVRVLVDAAKFGLALSRTKVMRSLGASPNPNPFPGCETLEFLSDAYLECALRRHTMTLWHFGGTCKMGPDSDASAVVDPQLRVRGVRGLRVADTSVMPTLPSGNTNAPVIMVAEKAADMVREQWITKEDLYGGCCGSTKKDTIVGGWAWAWWFVTDVQRLSLEVMTLNPMCESVETAQGVPLTVTGVAQCKIMKADELLQTASEQFLGKSVKEIKSTVLQTLEGHLRAILGTLTVEEVYKDRDQFAALVREVAAPDVGRMGIEILSFTIKDVYDEVQYLASLGKSQTAAVKRDADIGVAQANRDAGIREAECEKSAMDIKYTTDTKIEDNSRMFKLQKANFDKEVNTAKAEAQLAYELQAAKIRQRIRNEEIQIEVVERRKQIEVEAQEVERKERELMATVRLPAEAESYKVQAIAEGKRTQTVEVAKAEAEKIKKIGAAEAYAIEGVGKAEAERMRMKAAVYKQYGDAAIMSLVLDALPKIAAEVAAPLAKTEEIVLLGGEDRGTSEVTRLVGQIPPAVHALTGVDLSKVLGKVPGAK